LLEVSRSGFYAWLGRSGSRELNDRQLLQLIREIFAQSHETYGSPRIYRELRIRGDRCDKARVERLMQENGITPPRKKKYRVTTNSNHKNPVAPNVLQRDFTSPAPNRRWASDITYIWTLAGWLYVAVVLDLFSRRVVARRKALIPYEIPCSIRPCADPASGRVDDLDLHGEGELAGQVAGL